ncbi:MAG: CoA transferase subunit A [Chloroflexota bacterium]
MKSKLTSKEQAVGLVADGDLVTVGGVSLHRVPMELVRELIRQGRKSLRLVDREPGLAFDLLIGAGLVRSVRFAMLGFELLGFAPNFRRAAEAGELEVTEDTCGAVINGLRAASMGVPFLPVQGLFGSDLLGVGVQKDNYRVMKDPFSGHDIVAIRAIEPDVALLHAQRADEYGNVQIGGGRFEDVWKARAAKKVIVSVDEVVDHDAIVKEPHMTTLPHPYVEAVVHLARGAWPASCYGLYGADYDHLREYVSMVRDGQFNSYLERYVHQREDS